MNELCKIIVLLVNLVISATANDVLGCGGFIKSHVPIDFSKVEVKLFTKQGILKDKTSCAPNNGYYFVPLYDKGEYVLQLEPPAGWSFNPTKINLNVDGVNDLCSQSKDINFVFKGFGITGKVESVASISGSKGPEGVTVELRSGSETRTTTTNNAGSFFFTPVFPGSYVVSISHPKWKIYKKSVDVKVTEGNTDLPAKSFLVQGYDVSGVIKTAGEPIKDTIVVLFQSAGSGNVLVDGCQKDSLLDLKQKSKPLCHTKTNENGVFTFGTVPNGEYYVLPYYKEQNIHFTPEQIAFKVEHDSLTLQTHFEIVGFSTTGYVLKSPNGAPIPNAKVYLDGSEITKTDAKGAYKLEKLRVGNYKIRVEADALRFNELVVKVNPNTKLADFVPSAFKVCGKVTNDESQTITFDKVGSTVLVTSHSDAKTGEFCEYLAPGKYDVQVVVNQGNKQKGLQFFPIKQTIEVSADKVNNLVFSQLKATVSGKVHCLTEKDCQGLQVILKSHNAESAAEHITINVESNSYSISNIYPGGYDVVLTSNQLCWKSNVETINVNSGQIQVPAFEQTGYSLHFISSHSAKVSYKLPNKSDLKKFDVAKGRSTICVEKPGTYSFEIESCHSYESNVVQYKTDSDVNEVQLKALKHTITLLIDADKQQEKIEAVVKIGPTKTIVEPRFVNNQYAIELLLSPTESAVVVPQSNILHFTPPILSVAGGEDCANVGVKFKAVKGKVFKGKVIPPLEGVTITVESDNTESLITETDATGAYKFQPLDASIGYTISAKKDSYVLVGPDKNGVFHAHKLAEIVVEVLTENKTPLQGTLLSLSGGESYRSNLQTNEDGRISFHSLSPSEYFLRPMMKEYHFQPTSKIIPVKEGETVNVQLIGKRVAYSAFGQVTSLNGVAEENMIVIASGTGNCSHFSEESSSESSGQFRIRGLQPYCSYDILVKNNHDDIEKKPASASIHIDSVTDDVQNLKLIVFRPALTMDILVKVLAENPDHYKYLKVKMNRESSPQSLLHSIKIDTSAIKLKGSSNTGVLLHVPSVPADGKSYSVQIESSLPHSNKWKPQVVHFNANSSFKFVELDFVVKANISEQYIKKTSIWALVLIFTCIAVLYNIEMIAVFLRDKFNYNISGFTSMLPNMNSKKSNDYYDNAEIDQIVQSINNVKRKPKPKKA